MCFTDGVTYEEHPNDSDDRQTENTTCWRRPFVEDNEECVHCDCLVKVKVSK